MYLTLRRKLTISVVAMIMLILIIIAGVKIIVMNFEKTSEKLILEYHELHALQEFKISLNKATIILNDLEHHYNIITENQLVNTLNESKNNLRKCREVLTRFHNMGFLKELENAINELELSIKILIDSADINQLQCELILIKINSSIQKVDILIQETQHEIEEFEKKGKTAILHGSFTIVTIGLIMIIGLLVGGIAFVRNLTKPIGILVNTAQRISNGEMKLRVKVDSNDEFLVLANSFNEMLDILDKTTISEKYMKSIVDNLTGALVVSDSYCKIRYVNSFFLELVGYSENEILMKHISTLFDNTYIHSGEDSNEQKDLDSWAIALKNKSHIKIKNGNTIPVMTTCNIFKNKYNEIEGLIFVAHDLTEKKAHEEEKKRIRNDQIIAINEAQEQERMRIATDIHDGIGQMLTSINYSIQNLNSKDKCNPEVIDKIQKQIDLTVKEAKNLAYNIMPLILKDFGLVAAIDDLLGRANQLNMANYSFNHYDIDDRLDSKVEKALYRICQESVNNIIKHSKATNATFQLFRTDESIILTIEDDGIGFENSSLNSMGNQFGIGLISIRERVLSFNGTFTIDSQINKGTGLIVEIPFKKT